MLRTERTRRLFKEGSWIIFGQVLMVVGSLAGVRLLTEMLPPRDYGELALGMTIATLVNQIILGPLGGGIIRFYAPAVECDDLAGYLSAVKKMVLHATGIIILIAALAIVGLLVTGQTYWIPMTACALVFAILSGYSTSLGGIQTAARQRAIVAVHQGIEPLLRSVIAAGLLAWLGTSSVAAMVGYAIAILFILGSQLYFFQRTSRNSTCGKTQKNWQDEIWKFSWPIGIFGIFTWLQLASDRWALQFFASTSEVGGYAVLYQLGYYPISLLTGMAMQFLVPILYQRAGDASDNTRNAEAKRLSWQLTWLSLGLTGVAFLVALLLHAQLFRVLVAEEYRTLSYLMPWIIVSGGIFASGQTLASNLQAQMKTREMMAAKIVTAILGIALNFSGAYLYGITGIICAGILFSILYFFWMVVLVNNGSKEECFC